MNANQLLAELESELEALPEKRTAPMRRVRRAFPHRLKDQPAARVKREDTNKLKTGLKNP
ncbi:MAG: hypothetical protein R3248_15280 [Candidatus Promineifilaceae bacterium]|nr:hypothetical protein [Candidatus Promineifilaceae bacterium]